MPIDENIIVFPGTLKPIIKQISTIDVKGYNEKKFGFTSHISTHIDAPIHMLPNGKTLTDFSIDKFVGTSLILDVSGQKEIVADISKVEKEDIVFFYTNYNKNVYQQNYFENNPVISEETANDLIDKQIKIIGIDSFTPDNKPYKIHKMLLKNDILIVENLTNLEKILNKRFKSYILPLKIQDADGAPCRVVAEIN
jgi:kynurenine formamidase